MYGDGRASPGGGGVGLYGQGADGSRGVYAQTLVNGYWQPLVTASSAGQGGSGGDHGVLPSSSSPSNGGVGGLYGGGGSAGCSGVARGGYGGAGGVRVVWGSGVSFPSNAPAL